MLIRTLAVVALSAVLAACSANPATGRVQFDALSRDQEIQIGEQAMPELIDEFGGAVPAPAVQAYVNQVGSSMVPHTEADFPDLPWEFVLLDSEVINAFALPGGKVFVSRGMAEAMENEAQLAAVLGHEIGHVTARHINERFGQQMQVGLVSTALGLLIGDGGTGAQIAGVATDVAANLVLLGFSREQELEADELGMRYMTRAGYDPEGMLQMMAVLQREAAGRGGIQFFSTHPNPDTRAARITETLQTQYTHAQGQPGFALNPEQYRQRMLAPLAQIPPAQRRSDAGSAAGGRMRLSLADPGTWCAHCAAAARK